MENFIQQLKTLSSAEDFLHYFGVPFDQAVVNVSRLHILKRFFQYIRQQNLQEQNNEVVLFTSYREQLIKATRTSSPPPRRRKRCSRCSRTPTAASM